MAQLKELLETFNFHTFVYSFFLLLASIIFIYETIKKICSIFGIKFRSIEQKDEQAKKIEALEKGQEELKEAVNALRKSKCVELWRDITRDGMECITKGTISYSEAAIFKSMYQEYKANFGNGHVEGFVKCVNALPYSEEVTPEQVCEINKQTSARVSKAQAALSLYYITHGVE